MVMGFYDDILARLGRAVETKFDGKPSRLAKEAGTTTTVVSRILKGERQAWLQSFSKIADAAGLTAGSEGDNTDGPREVCFVDARMVGSDESAPPSVSEEYLAVPLIRSSDDVTGPVDPGRVDGWVLVWRRHESVRFKSDLIAFEVGRNELSMIPTLHPGDIVLVDRNDADPSPAGRMMLVVEPGGIGTATIKRVSTREVEGDVELVYYSDNAKEYPPSIYRLNGDYNGDIGRAVVGRVLWAWSDMSRK